MLENPNKPSPFLTVAIPHLNDPDGLLSTLKAVSRFISEDTEIIVLDNKSDDVYESALERVRSSYDGVEFIKSSKELDYDTNIERCICSSRGDFVWLVGCGDFPLGQSIPNIVRILNHNQDATNFRVQVRTADDDAQGTVTPKNKKIRQKKAVNLDSLFSSALSGNIFKREAWLAQSRTDLVSTNWVHVERALQMLSQKQSRFVEIPSEKAAVFVHRPETSWWNQDDHTFLLNTLLFRSILSHYRSYPGLQRYSLPFKPNRVSATLIKAMLYSRTIEISASKETKELVRKHLVNQNGLQTCYRIIYAIPKQLVRISRTLLKSLYRRISA